MSDVLEKIEERLDKVISNLENMKDKKLIKTIDDLEGIKTIILTDDIIKLSGQLHWRTKREKKYD